MPDLRVTPVVALAKEEQPLSTYLGLIEDPIVVGITSEGFLDAPCRTGNIGVGNGPDLDRHSVDRAFWTLRCRVQNAHTRLAGASVRVKETNYAFPAGIEACSNS